MSFDASLLVIMGLFWATYAVVRWFLVGPMVALLKSRESEIAESQEQLDAATKKVEAALDEERERLAELRQTARAANDERRREAQKKRDEMVLAAQADAKAKVDDAVARLREEVEGQRAALSGQASELAQLMSQRLLGGSQ